MKIPRTCLNSLQTNSIRHSNTLDTQRRVRRAVHRTFTMTTKEPRRFAPLKHGAQRVDGALKLKGIVFDMDGTLCLPQNYMFGEMRAALGITKSVDILDHIYELPSSQQPEAHEKIRAIERNAMSSQQPQPGLLPLMEYLEGKNLPKGICTRNFELPVNHLLGKFLEGKKLEPIITREFRPPKPHPAGILSIAKSWGFLKKDGEGDASQLIMVGDSIDDMTAGYRAGAATVLLVNEVNAHLAEHEHTDLCISRLDELIQVLEEGFVGRIGKGDEESDTKGRAEEVLREGAGESTLK